MSRINRKTWITGTRRRRCPPDAERCDAAVYIKREDGVIEGSRCQHRAKENGKCHQHQPA